MQYHHIHVEDAVLYIYSNATDDDGTHMTKIGVPIAEIQDRRKPLIIIGEPVDMTIGSNNRLTDNPLDVQEAPKY